MIQQLKFLESETEAEQEMIWAPGKDATKVSTNQLSLSLSKNV